MSLMRRPLLLVGGIVAVVVLAGATVWVSHDTTSTMRPEEARTAAPAGAKLRTCAKSVLADWYDDGRVSKLYPVACYTAALTKLPTDIRHFSTAAKDIQRALDLARDGKFARASPASSRPSERACLIAWNTPANAALRSRIAASGPWSTAALRPGTTYGFVLERGSSATHTTAQACLMTLSGPSRSRLVVGIWRGGRVVRWRIVNAVTVDKARVGSNVKVLPDGRVTKIYLR